jgi:hypothetical protein
VPPGCHALLTAAAAACLCLCCAAVLDGLSPQYPSVSILNWTTGAGTARYQLLHLLIREFAVGDALVNTTVTGGDGSVYAQAYASGARQRQHKLLLINKQLASASLTVAGATGGVMLTVDEASGEQPARREKITEDSISLAPFAVSVLIMPQSAAAAAAAGMQ